MRLRAIRTTVALLLAGGAASAQVGPAITEFPLPPGVFSPWQLAPGRDGNVWFTVQNAPAYLGRITPLGSIVLYPLPSPNGQPTGIAAGPGGNLWITETAANRIVRVSPLAPQSMVEFPVPSAGNPTGVAAGRDGNMWFCETGFIARITPSGDVTEFALPWTGQPQFITAGSDGALWFTDPGALQGRVGRITTDGAISGIPFPLDVAQVVDDLGGIAAGADGNLWSIGQAFGGDDRIVRITPQGAFTMFRTPTTFVESTTIGPGPDGNVWFVVNNGSQLVRVAPNGAMTSYDIPTPRSESAGMTIGPDGNLWFSEIYPINQVARVGLAQPATPVPELSEMATVVLALLLLLVGGTLLARR